MFENTAMRPFLPATDIDRAKRWYSEKLGLEPVNETELGDFEYRTGGVTFVVYESQLAGTNQATAAGFQVEDFDSAIAKLRSNGVSFEHVDFGEMGATVDGVIAIPGSDLKAAWFKDSEGNILSVTNEG